MKDWYEDTLKTWRLSLLGCLLCFLGLSWGQDDSVQAPAPSQTEVEAAEQTQIGPPATFGAPGESTQPQVVIGVIYFQNAGKDSTYDPLQKALTDMVITDLSQVSSLKLVERTRMADVIKEKDFTVAEANEKAGRLEMVKTLQAAKTLTGRFKVDEQKQMDLKAAFIKPEENKLDIVAKADGSVENFFDLEKKLVFSIVDAMDIKLSDEERLKIEVIPTENLLAMLAYGSGLDAQDKGDFAAAQKAFKVAVKLDPNFKEAAELAKQMADKTGEGTEEQAEEQTEDVQEEPVAEADKMPVGITGTGPAAEAPADDPAPPAAARAPGAPTAAAPDAQPAVKRTSAPVLVTTTAVRLSNRVGGAFMPEVLVRDNTEPTAPEPGGEEEPVEAGLEEQIQDLTGDTNHENRRGFPEYSGAGFDSRKSVTVSIPIPDVQ